MLLSIQVIDYENAYVIINQFFSVFDVTIILTILINCVFLALDDPVDELEYVFTAIYTLEVVIKVSVLLFINDQKRKKSTTISSRLLLADLS